MSRPRPRLGAWAFLLAAALAVAPRLAVADGGGTASPAGPAAGTPPTLVVGEFTLGDDPVIDGDTLRLSGGAGNVRLLSLDAEEVFVHGKGGPKDKRGEEDERRAKDDFPAYAKEKRGDSKTPVKFGTPMGVEAQGFLRDLLKGVLTVRLERDEVGRDRDAFGRFLAHVFASKGGKDLFVEEEVVRAGMSPYFTKYGRSKRFDARLKLAQSEAMEAKRGIWGDRIPHYPDYDERLSWWDERSKQVEAWEAERAADPKALDKVTLGVPSETDRFEHLLGKKVTVFGSEDHLDGANPKQPKRAAPDAPALRPFVAWMTDRPHLPFAVVAASEEVWKGLDLDAVMRRFVRATGTVVKNADRYELRLDAAADLSTK